MRSLGSLLLVLPLALPLSGCIIITDGSTASDSGSGSSSAGSDSSGGGSTEAGTGTTSEGTGSASGSTSSQPTSGATTGGAAGQPSSVSESCAPDDGPAAEFTIGLIERACGAGFPAEAPMLRISLFQSLPLAAGEYNLDGGFGQVFYDDGNGLVSGNSGKLTITSVTADGYLGTYDVTLMDNTNLVGDLDAIYCPIDPLCG